PDPLRLMSQVLGEVFGDPHHAPLVHEPSLPSIAGVARRRRAVWQPPIRPGNRFPGRCGSASGRGSGAIACPAPFTTLCTPVNRPTTRTVSHIPLHVRTGVALRARSVIPLVLSVLAAVTGDRKSVV